MCPTHSVAFPSHTPFFQYVLATVGGRSTTNDLDARDIHGHDAQGPVTFTPLYIIQNGNTTSGR